MLKRREMLKVLGASAAALAQWNVLAAQDDPAARPNILWILSEDIGPDIGSYGTPCVKTPHLDKLASEGIRFSNAFTTSPVCSPSRSAMITGMYQTTIDAHQHRSHRGDGRKLPEGIKLVTDCFREAGYFTANVTTAAPGVRGSGKNDFNFNLDYKPFDGSDWNQRRGGQPFFAQLSIGITHRGRQWQTTVKEKSSRIEPEKVDLPPYYPDDPIARADWATYLESIQVMDSYMGEILKRLDREGLMENTIVLFIGDNGRCHVRGKQWLYDAGIHIPLIVRWPAKLKGGEVRDDMVSAIDIAPTLLELSGIEPPRNMQGQVFLGPQAVQREYIFAARDRCDETAECIRCVRTKRYKYIRNYMAYRPYMQPNQYKDKGYPVRNLLRELHAKGKLTPAQAQFMAERKPVEELYDVQEDPHEIHNLAPSPEHRDLLDRLRAAHVQWMQETKDLGLIPEPELLELSKKYGDGYAVLQQKENRDLIARLRAVIELGEEGKSAMSRLIEAMKDGEASVRYWAATGLGNLGDEAKPAAHVLTDALKDSAGCVRVASAEALCRMGMESEALPVLVNELKNENPAVRHYAALALEEIGEKPRPALDALKAARKDGYDSVRRVAMRAVGVLEGSKAQ